MNDRVSNKHLLTSALTRYGLAVVLFGVLLGISLLLNSLDYKVNLTVLVVIALVAASWYGGKGPGIFLTVLLEIATIILTPIPADVSVPRIVFSYISVLLVLLLIVFLISGRKSAEQRLRDQGDELRHLNETLEQRVNERTLELEAANGELESFSYSVSHDLRSPLRAIDGFSAALLEDYPDKLDAKGQLYLNHVRAASQNMAQLIEDLLKLARVTRAEISRTNVDMSTIAREILSELQKGEPLRSAQFEIQDNMNAYADERLLKVVLQNLLDNAWKFTSKIPTTKIEVGESPNGNKTEFFIRDNGAGFDMAYADKLFGAFQRLHSASEFEGTGIGLATVQRVVRKHGGLIRAESAVGEGTGFYFTL